MARKWSRLALLIVALLLGPVPCYANDLRGVALVIGESEYASDKLRDLGNPKNDARGMDDLLTDLGFQVERALNDNRADLEDDITRFLRDAQGADVALVYYSGHGIEAGGENYLVPTDADLTSPSTAGASLVPVKQLLDRLARTVPVTITLLDACRTNAFPAGTTIEVPGMGRPVEVTSTGLGEARGPMPVAQLGGSADSLGMVIGFAAAPGHAALDGEVGGHSPYAAALLKHLGAGGYSFADLMTMVSEEVYLSTDGQQIPWANSSLRRVLSFGQPRVSMSNADEALIIKGRRELLLTISTTPEPVRTAVATIAEAKGIPLAPLFGVLRAIGVDTVDPDQLEERLTTGAEEIKKRLAELSAVTNPDPEVKRLLDLSRRAEDEGALAEALQFALRASARTTELSEALDTLAANIDQRRAENAATYARAGDAASLSWQFQTAAEQYALAADQLGKAQTPDTEVVFDYRTRQGKALTDLGELKGENAALAKAVELYTRLLATVPQERHPLDWATTQNNLGATLRLLGEREGRADRLKAAVAAYRLALEVRTRELVPLDWAATQNNLGNALTLLGMRESGASRMEEAVTAYQLALEERTRDRAPLDWATTQNNLGNALQKLGEREGSSARLEEAVVAYRSALEEWTRDREPLNWARAQHNLGGALESLGWLTTGTSELEQSIAAFQLALGQRKRDRVATRLGSDATQSRQCAADLG